MERIENGSLLARWIIVEERVGAASAAGVEVTGRFEDHDSAVYSLQGLWAAQRRRSKKARLVYGNGAPVGFLYPVGSRRGKVCYMATLH